MSRISLHHLNLAGAANVLGFGVTSLTASLEWQLALLDSGVVEVTRGSQTCYISPHCWVSAEAQPVEMRQGALESFIGAADVAARSDIPEGKYLTSEGNVDVQARVKNSLRARKK